MKSDNEIINGIWNERGPVVTPRKLNSPDDWGDDDTRMISLKKKNYYIANMDDFSYYLGEYEGSYYVGLKDWEGHITRLVKYDSLEVLKNKWECD